MERKYSIPSYSFDFVGKYVLTYQEKLSKYVHPPILFQEMLCTYSQYLKVEQSYSSFSVEVKNGGLQFITKTDQGEKYL